MHSPALYVRSWLATEKMDAERMLVADELPVRMLLVVSQESGESLGEVVLGAEVEVARCFPLALVDVVGGRAEDRSSRDHNG